MKSYDYARRQGVRPITGEEFATSSPGSGRYFWMGNGSSIRRS